MISGLLGSGALVDLLGRLLVESLGFFLQGGALFRQLLLSGDGLRLAFRGGGRRDFSGQFFFLVGKRFGFGSEGQALFNADGEPSEFTQGVQKQLENFEQEVERTRLAGAVLVEKGLLRDMRFDATLRDVVPPRSQRTQWRRLMAAFSSSGRLRSTVPIHRTRLTSSSPRFTALSPP